MANEDIFIKTLKATDLHIGLFLQTSENKEYVYKIIEMYDEFYLSPSFKIKDKSLEAYDTDNYYKVGNVKSQLIETVYTKYLNRKNKLGEILDE